ncbi:MAG: UvrD-helicase domain-containing protein [Victivallales bacterium]|nr:UvrD-helicase domain-containing protein [Victivallales bacterium]
MEMTFDTQILEPGFDMSGTHLVAASAGTGKTYNIQNIYARIIMENDYQVSQVQVMTFTEAATKELKDRLHAVLKDLQHRFAGEACDGKDEDDTARRNERADKLIACAADKDRARQRVELALLDFDNAAITTIHGFCQRVLARYAFETGINLAMTIEDNKVAELNRLALDWWRKHPEAASNGLSLGTLQEYVNKLGGKADYTIVNHEPTRGAGLALAVAEKIVDDYEKDRPHREKQNFDDLLRALWDALKAENGQDLARKLRQDFKAALIDEFQDTDPVQYDIFRRVFLEGNLPLFFVGDPKQAIYSFRGGDIFTYMKACAIPGLKKHDLNTNFRSTKHLMEAINGLFKDVQDEQGVVHYTFSSSDIDYPGTVKVLQEPKIKGPDLEQPFRIIKISDEITTSADRHAAIRSVLVRQILGILSERDADGKPIFTPKDIAVLMNTHSQENALQKELRKLGVPSVIAKSGNVFATSAAYELSAFLEAILQPYGMVLRRGLATVFGGAPAEEIASDDNTEAMAEYVKLFKELGEAWQKRGFYALMAKLEGLGYKTRIAAMEDGERMLTDMAQLLELCFATAKKIGPSTEKLLDWLEECIRQASSGEDDSEEYMRELEKDGDTVKIMTIHVSKGLQFPIVFLPECWNLMSPYDPRNKFPLPYYHQDDGERKLVFELDLDKNGAKKRNSSAEIKAKKELLQEKMRLLYVAMTRAVQRTILITPSVDAGKEPLGYLLGKAMNVPSIQWLDANGIQGGISKYRQVLEQEPQPKEALHPAKFNLLPTKGSYSSLSPSAKENENEDGRDDDSLDNGQRRQAENEAALPIFNMPCGTRIGTCWHNILEKIPFDASDDKLSQIAADELASCGYAADGELLQTTVDMLRKVLDHTLASPSGELFKLSQIGWEQRLSEQEFDFSSAAAAKTTQAIKAILEKHWKDDAEKEDFLKAMEDWDRPIPNGFFNGFIDLIFQNGDFFYIVDWKSNILDSKKENFNASGIRKEMAKHGYFLQYLLYSAVLHRYLKETLGDAYSWEHNFGGIRYFFLRGVAAEAPAPIFEDRPSEALLDELCAALGMK